MTSEIAEQIAELLNSQNQLIGGYNADTILSNAKHYIYYSDENCNLAGAVEVKRVQWYQCEIRHLSVIRKRQGIGSRLLLDAINRAKQLGCQIAQCTIRKGNSESEALFTKHGFMAASGFINPDTGNCVVVYQKSVQI